MGFYSPNARVLKGVVHPIDNEDLRRPRSRDVFIRSMG
jgi:hypothetical protein